MCRETLFVHRFGHGLAHNGLYPIVQHISAQLHAGIQCPDVFQRRIQRRREALVQTYVLNVIVNHKTTW